MLNTQLYTNPDREKAKQLIQNAEKKGMKALCVTVDALTLGRREKGLRLKKASAHLDVADDDSVCFSFSFFFLFFTKNYCFLITFLE